MVDIFIENWLNWPYKKWLWYVRVSFNKSLLVLKLWTDYNLQWNPDENGGIRNVRLPSSSIWTPDVLMHDM